MLFLPTLRTPRTRRRDPDAWTLGDGRPRYVASAPVAADVQLVSLLVEACHETVGPQHTVRGLDATADSFYSSQGRLGSHFDDGNDSVITDLLARYPNLVSLEMETFHLLDLARCSRGSIKAAAFCIAAAERYSNRCDGRTQLMRGGARVRAVCAVLASRVNATIAPPLRLLLSCVQVHQQAARGGA